jgi:predicted transcriptional regulator
MAKSETKAKKDPDRLKAKKAKQEEYKAQGRQTGPKFTPTERESVLSRVEEMDSMGYNQLDISRELGVSQSTASGYLRQVRERYIQQTIDSYQERVGEKLAQYKLIRKEAWEAWRESKKVVTKTRDEEGTITSSNITSISKSVVAKEESRGDARFLIIILDTLLAERDLLGLDAPKKKGEEGNKPTIDWDLLASGIPIGPLPDLIEGEILRAATILDNTNPSTSTNGNTTYSSSGTSDSNDLRENEGEGEKEGEDNGQE